MFITRRDYDFLLKEYTDIRKIERDKEKYNRTLYGLTL